MEEYAKTQQAYNELWWKIDSLLAKLNKKQLLLPQRAESLIMRFEIEGKVCWLDLREYQANQDYWIMTDEEYYRKYPEYKPEFNNRVTLDEADKIKL